MLTNEEISGILKTAALYPHKQAAAAEALMIVQERRGWISDETLCAVAATLDMTEAELDSIATFYSHIFRSPVGKHVIRVCDGVSCWITSGSSLFEQVQKRLGISPGQTTPDGMFTLLPVSCLGVCEQAPAIMVDRTVFGKLTGAKLDAIIEEYRLSTTGQGRPGNE